MKNKITCIKSMIIIVIIIGFITEIAIAQTAPTIPIPSQQQLDKPFQKRGIFNGPMLNMSGRQNVPSVGVGAIKMIEGQNRPSNWLTLGCDSITGNVMINRMPPNQQEDFLNQTKANDCKTF